MIVECEKNDLCIIKQVGKKYSVTWNKSITGLIDFNEKVLILIDMMTNKVMKSYEVGIMLSTGHVLWLSWETLATLDMKTLVEYVKRCGGVKDFREIEGGVFDNMDDVNTFITSVNHRYLCHLLKL
jgi:hypothetical protein